LTTVLCKVVDLLHYSDWLYSRSTNYAIECRVVVFFILFRLRHAS